MADSKLNTIADTVSGWLTPKPPKKKPVVAPEDDSDDMNTKVQNAFIKANGGQK